MKEHMEKNYEKVISWSIEDLFKQNCGEKAAQSQFEQLQEVYRLSENMKILDLGCGYGFFVSHMLEKGFDCYGVDIDRETCSLAKALLEMKDQDSKRIRISAQTDAGYSTGFRDALFDLVHMYFVMEHVANIDDLFNVMSSPLARKWLQCYANLSRFSHDEDSAMAFDWTFEYPGATARSDGSVAFSCALDHSQKAIYFS